MLLKLFEPTPENDSYFVGTRIGVSSSIAVRIKILDLFF
jgi:hypothetical protein